MSTSVSRMVAERNHRVLLELTLKPGNDTCADCKARAPRWASHNLGIFICVSCASIHRKIGTHITKVKSITLDEWSKEQVEVMKEMGNLKSNALYNPDEIRHPPPTNMIDSERDSELEKFIRSKYEFKRFIHRASGTTPRQPIAEPRMARTVPRPRSTPLTDSSGPPPPSKTPENLPSNLRPLAVVPTDNVLLPARSFSQPIPPLTNSDKLTAVPPLRQPSATLPSMQKPVGQVWEDLVSLQGPSQSSSLPLQYSSGPAISPSIQQLTISGSAQNPFTNLALGQTNPITPLVASPISTPSVQFPFVSTAPLSSPALHFGVANPFNQAFIAASATGAAFSTSSNLSSSTSMSTSVATSTPTMPSAQTAMALPVGPMPQTSSLPYVMSQTSRPTPALSFPPAPFATAPVTPILAQNPFAPAVAAGQVPPSATELMNPFSAVPMGQAGFSGTSSQAAFGPALSQQQQHHQLLGVNRFDRWAGQGAQGTF